MQDLPGVFRYTLRQFRLSPVFTATAILTLALGIGASGRETAAAWKAGRRTVGACTPSRSMNGSSALILAAFIAAVIPATRAASISPIKALRIE